MRGERAETTVVGKAEQRERTRAALVDIAARRFARDGYAGVALDDVVGEAGLTRGAVYHHFGSKQGLFRAVVEHAQHHVAGAVERAADGDGPALARFLDGCRAFLEASLDHEVRRILLVDGPAVLGWADWREGDLDTSVPLLDEGVAELAAAGVIEGDLAVVATMVSGALNELALAAAERRDAAARIDAGIATLERMLSGLSPKATA
ncbi:TetR/AcrR family transcriptional regulator [Agromyces archimandritae]|uniref:TetR/AcrR family transcriptional regulator n=1 Tax=Agromyces archimandritae TaxID=2781962 RepID=A0A975FMU1_9MICO|nr:TetR/AcrR family transcriptional regulator [Agromyces archimandritae]QTX03901.1 TetR/AcrR family transcriptional regulator [Agromyces archimandritae]